jgi:glycosyltransferase involved in cell wall biosynthesis
MTVIAPGERSYHASSELQAVREHLRGLRILATCDYFSDDSSGGIERVAVKVLERLLGWGAEVRVLTALPPGMRPFEAIPAHLVKVVRLRDLSRVVRVQASLAPAAIGAALALCREFHPQVIYVNGLHFQTSVAGAILQRRSGLPMVTASHVGGLEFLSQPTRAVTQLYEQILGRFILRRSSRVISISQSVTDHLLQLGTPRTKIDVVPNGVDLDHFCPDDAASHGTPLTLMFVGRHIANKGPQVFLEALVSLHRSGVPFVAVFLSDGPLRPSLEERTVQAGLATKIRFLGHVPDVAKEMRRADVIVRPSFTEGMPLTTLEAMASGVCLVVSDIPGNRDLLVDGVNGLLIPVGDADRLAAALRRVIDDSALRLRLATEGRATASRYGWEACAQGTADSLLRAVGNPAG